jgi:hypothetical protein
VIRRINREFDEDRIANLAQNAEAFRPGQSLDVRLLEGLPHGLGQAFQAYFDSLPGSLRETLRSVIYYALTTEDGPIPITFSWVPAYDAALTIWEMPCATITVLIQSRYPPGDVRAEQMRHGEI